MTFCEFYGQCSGLLYLLVERHFLFMMFRRCLLGKLFKYVLGIQFFVKEFLVLNGFLLSFVIVSLLLFDQWVFLACLLDYYLLSFKDLELKSIGPSVTHEICRIRTLKLCCKYPASTKIYGCFFSYGTFEPMGFLKKQNIENIFHS